MHSPATLAYFCAPPGHLWEWEDVGVDQAAVWSEGQTLIAFRQELVELLEACVPVGLPPLGSILWLIAASSESCNASANRIRLWEAAERATGSKNVPVGIASLWKTVGAGLDQIHALPADLRSSGPARRRLLRTLFEDVSHNLPRNIPPASALNILSEFVQTPFLNVFQQRSPELNGVARLLKDLTALEKAFALCPPEHLEERLRTGIDRMPSRPLDLPLPEPDAVPLPEPPADLLRALEHEGGELAQVAGLVRRIGAMLHVPKAVTQREELPLGGVSDITNRGDPSRLLMTELAWDDLTFAVRLAQGEALYLRRESPPAEPPPRRLVLIDTGIFMWGKPRLFALGSALALLRQKRGEQAPIASIFAVDADGFKNITLGTVMDVRAQLARLQPCPHPGSALTLLADAEPSPFQPNEEVFLITHPAALETLCHLPVWRHLATSVPLHTLLVDRDGNLELSRHSLAGARPLAHARIDAEDLFEPQPAPHSLKPSPAALTSEAGRLPQFYRQRVWPLDHPAPPLEGKTYLIPNKGYVGVSKAGCVCWWAERYALVGKLLLLWMPAGELVYAGLDKTDPDTVFLAFRSQGAALVELAVISLNHPEVLGVYSVEIGHSDTFFPCFNSGYLVVHLDTCSDAYSCLDEATKLKSISRSAVRGWPVFDGSKFHEHGVQDLPCTKLDLAKNLTPQDSPRRFITHVESVTIDGTGRLMILTQGSHIYRLDVLTHGFSWVGCNVSSPPSHPFQSVAALRWQDFNLRIALFPDGRRVIIDPRGFLHVCDCGDEADEISVMLVKGHTAAWTPDGKHFGESNLLWRNWPKSMTDVMPLARKLFRACVPDKVSKSQPAKSPEFHTL